MIPLFSVRTQIVFGEKKLNSWKIIGISALALSLGWGIRGQYGGQGGALIAGTLFGLALGIAIGHPSAIPFAATVAVATSFGGAMSYGQTIGLTQDSPRLGMTGLALKGALWIGNAGLWTGIAAGFAPYSPFELEWLSIGQFVAGLVGVGLLNRPHEPPERLPRFSFSQRNDPHPRVEWWGGLLFGYGGLLLYVAFVKHDAFATGLGLFGALGGLGFPLGQSVQAWARFREPFGKRIQQWCDEWKAMELIFGGIAGGVLATGWEILSAQGLTPFHHEPPSLPLLWEAVLMGLYGALFFASVLRVRWITVGLMAPYAEGILLLTPALTGKEAGKIILLGVTSAVAAIQNARRFYADGLVSSRKAALLAVGGTALLIAIGVPFAEEEHSLFLVLVWTLTLSTVPWSASKALFRPDPKHIASRGRLFATLSEWGTALPVEAIFILLAALLTTLGSH